MNEELILQLGSETDMDLQFDDSDSLELQLGDAAGTTNYNALTNKPQINGQTLIGNKTIAELLGGGLILDGGTAQEVAS